MVAVMDPAVALVLITLTGPDNQRIELNPQEIVSLREPRKGEDHFPSGTKCLINTADGKIVVVQETCSRVHELLKDGTQ